jgi:hypothetical protein
LGVGETFHSHGYLHHGYMMPLEAASIVEELRNSSHWWRTQRLIPEEPPAEAYYVVGTDSVEERREIWERLGLRYRLVETAPEALHGGLADTSDVQTFSIADRTVSMREVVGRLADGLQNRMLSARLESIELAADGGSVSSCTLSVGNQEILVRPQVLILACGRGAQPLLRAARTSTGMRPLQRSLMDFNQIRFVPMLLVRGRDLPQLTCFFENLSFCMMTHGVSDDESMWVVTPLGGHETKAADYVPEREWDSGGKTVGDTIRKLRAIFPDVGDRFDRDLLFSFYFGGKIDHPMGGNRRYVADCGIRNLRLCWPGLWSLARPNAREVVGQLQEDGEFARLFDPKSSDLDLWTGLEFGVPVGEELRLTESLQWSHLPEFQALHGFS